MAKSIQSSRRTCIDYNSMTIYRSTVRLRCPYMDDMSWLLRLLWQLGVAKIMHFNGLRERCVPSILRSNGPCCWERAIGSGLTRRWIPVEDELSNYEQLKGMQPPPHAEKRTLRPTSREPQHMSKGDRLAGPYIWHVKDLIAQRWVAEEAFHSFPLPNSPGSWAQSVLQLHRDVPFLNSKFGRKGRWDNGQIAFAM